MSNFSDFVLAAGAEVLLPLEENDATLVNIGSEGVNVTGTHTDATYQQTNLVLDQTYSMKFDRISYTTISMSTPVTITTLFFWTYVYTLNEFLFSMRNTSVADSTVSFCFEDQFLVIKTESTSKTTEVFVPVNTAVFMGMTYSNGIMKLFLNNELAYSMQIVLKTTVFDEIILSELGAACYETLVSETGDILTDASGNPLEVQVECP